MNRVISRASKLSKIIGKSNFLPRINICNTPSVVATSSKLLNISKMSFAENERNPERRFERFSDNSNVIFFKKVYNNAQEYNEYYTASLLYCH